jgi:hypothetical protein
LVTGNGRAPARPFQASFNSVPGSPTRADPARDPEPANMTAKVKLIKKEDRSGPASPVEAEASADPKEWSTAVKSWVSEFQKDRRDESLTAFDSLFDDPTQ